jgi:hypothetical protein
MRPAVSPRHIGAGCLMTLMTVLLLSLTSLPGAAQRPPNPDDKPKIGSDWEKVRQNYERALRAHREQIGAIEAKERRLSDPQKRAEKITNDAVTEAKAYLKGAGKGKGLAHTAEKAASQVSTLAVLDRAQAEYLDSVGAEWGERGAERKKLQEASAALEKNIDLIRSDLAVVTETAEAISTRVRQSGVLEKAVQGEAAAKEVGERLSARWERERAALEREREQREREAGERTRGGRIP